MLQSPGELQAELSARLWASAGCYRHQSCTETLSAVSGWPNKLSSQPAPTSWAAEGQEPVRLLLDALLPSSCKEGPPSSPSSPCSQSCGPGWEVCPCFSERMITSAKHPGWRALCKCKIRLFIETGFIQNGIKLVFLKPLLSKTNWNLSTSIAFKLFFSVHPKV